MTFDVYLSQKDNENLLFPSAVCKIFDHYSNYSVRNEFKVIPLYEVFNQLPDLIKLIDNNEIDALLSLLPNDNGRVNSITVSNVQDLCTALEVSYGWEKRTREKDELIEELKRTIRSSITNFMDEHPDMDVNNDTTIVSAFKYLDYTLKDRIVTLYHENQSVADIVSKKYALPLLSEENIAAFVKLRNGRVHRGKTEWGDSAEIYPVLLAIEYACVLKHIGVSQGTIDALAWRLF